MLFGGVEIIVDFGVYMMRVLWLYLKKAKTEIFKS